MTVVPNQMNYWKQAYKNQHFHEVYNVAVFYQLLK